MSDPYTDPNDLFDVYDAAGRPTGRLKRRADVHRDGDWHRSFHCWVVCEGGPVPAVLLQRRGAHKDTWPGKLDVTVGGHYAAGETLADVVREVEEEVGVAVALRDLIPLGRRVSVSEQEAGIRDRELQDVFLWLTQLDLASFRPQPVEVAALESAALPELLALLSAQSERCAVRVLRPDGALSPGDVRVTDFIPTVDSYFFRVATVIDQAIRGYPYLVV